MGKGDKVIVGVEQLTLSNSLQLTALVELLEERGILKQSDVLERMKDIREGLQRAWSWSQTGRKVMV